MTEKNDIPSKETVDAILNIITPAYVGYDIQSLSQDYANHTHLVTVEFADKPAQKVILRRYNEENGDCVGKAQREFHALKCLQQVDLPTPKPIYLDAEGEVFGSPGIVTAFVDGSVLQAETHGPEWASHIDATARMLARIHKTPISDELRPALMDANEEVSWFLRKETVPEFMQNDPDGAMVWQTVKDLMPQRKVIEPTLIHIDYWSGNVLWHNGEISAVVDWEEAAFGDPGVDVGYCRMELYLEGLNDAADRFLEVYEQEFGQPVANLALWELVASARPMTDPEGWFTRPMMRERFHEFILNAKARATM